VALFRAVNYLGFTFHCLRFLYDYWRGHPAGNASLSNALSNRDCHQYPNGNSNNRLLSQQYACPNGYRAADYIHPNGYRNHRASAE
jgi:hypothetical protein